jgi:vitamin B12 transporter
MFNTSYQRTQNLNYTQSEGKDNASTKKTVDLTQAQWANMISLNETVSLGGGLDVRREALGDDALSYGSAHTLAGESRVNKGVFASLAYDDRAFRLESSIRFDKHDVYDDYTTWSIASGYDISRTYSVRVNVGTAFKAPDFVDLSTTPDLEAEESLNYEVGLDATFANSTLGISVYDNTVDNLIIWYNNSGSWTSSNVDAEIKGIELDINFNTGFIHHELIAELKDHKDSKGVQLARRAKQNLKWITSSQFENITIDTTMNYQGKRLDLPTESPSSGSYIPASTTWDLSASYWFDSSLTMRFKVANIFDKNPETALGYIADGRNFTLNLDYNF